MGIKKTTYVHRFLMENSAFTARSNELSKFIATPLQ